MSVCTFATINDSCLFRTMSSHRCVVHVSPPRDVLAHVGPAVATKWLSAAETAMRRRFTREVDYSAHAAGRLLARCALAEQLGLAPNAFEIAPDALGKPALEHLEERQKFSFNISAVDDLVVCASCPELAIGVDVERIDRAVDANAVAAAFLHPLERDAILASGVDGRHQFLRLWTLKEAFLKARGDGLTLRLDSFYVELQATGARLNWFADALQERCDDWFVAHVSANSEHLIGLAVRSGSRPIELRVESAQALVERCLVRWG